MSILPEVNNPLFESLVAGHIRSQLELYGPAPWSICEARLSESDYKRLHEWAANVTVTHLNNGSSSAIVLLAFIAEWNRRNSIGDTVWVGLPQLFQVDAARHHLFTATGGPSQHLYRKMREACQHFQLRCIKDDEERTQRYYLTVQLQYGFSRPHALEQLRNWLRGHPAPEVARRLLDPDGSNRSNSFKRLVRDMKSYRRNYLPESEFRRTLRENPWVLATWEDEIVALVNDIPSEANEDNAEFRLLSEPRISWDDGPNARCRVYELPGHLMSPRYVLLHAGKELVRYFRNSSGLLEADRREAFLSLDKPEAIATLETPEGEVVEVQTIRIWLPEYIAQVRPIGRDADEPVERLLVGEQVLITSTDATVTPSPSVWKTFGSKEERRRWWLIDSTHGVTVNDDGIVWNGEPPPPPAAWTNTVRVNLDVPGRFFQLGDRVRFSIDVAKNVEVVHAACAGHPLNFTDTTRTQTAAIPVRAEMSGSCRLRVGVARGHESELIQREVDMPVRAVLWADDGGELPRNDTITCFELLNRPVKLLSEGPAVLIEGREILGSLPPYKAARIKRVLGTGQELAVADRPFITEERFKAAKSVIDSGFARSLEPHASRFRLKLFRAVIPNNRHQVFLWSPSHGMAILPNAEVSVECDGSEWTFSVPWDTDTLLAAVAYDGQCVAVSSCGDLHEFFESEATDGADPLLRVALIRWCRLPGLRPDAENRRRPLINRLADFPLEMVKVALLDQGLPEGLVFEDRQSPRGELFNVIFREAYVSHVPANVNSLFSQLGSDFDRLLISHPILGCRSLQSVLPEFVQQSRIQTKALLLHMRLQLLSLAGSAGLGEIARKEDKLLVSARDTFSENGEPMDEYALREGLIDPVLQHVMDGASLKVWHEDNLRTALGVAPFREYLVASILRRTLERLT